MSLKGSQVTPERIILSPAPRHRVGVGIVAVIAVVIAMVSIANYAGGSLESLAEDGLGLASTYVDVSPMLQAAFYVHIGAASLALLLGPAQFSRRIRQRTPRIHRLIGRTYLIAVAIGAISAVTILPVNSAGFNGFFGFGFLALLWAITGFQAYRSIRAGHVASHHAWMIRNYALTFAAATLRIWLGILIAIQLPFAGADPDFDELFDNAYAVVPFLSWLPNIVFAEWLIRRRGLPAYRIVPPPA